MFPCRSSFAQLESEQAQLKEDLTSMKQELIDKTMVWTNLHSSANLSHWRRPKMPFSTRPRSFTRHVPLPPPHRD
jgi:hypothetical protein